MAKKEHRPEPADEQRAGQIQAPRQSPSDYVGQKGEGTSEAGQGERRSGTEDRIYLQEVAGPEKGWRHQAVTSAGSRMARQVPGDGQRRSGSPWESSILNPARASPTATATSSEMRPWLGTPAGVGRPDRKHRLVPDDLGAKVICHSGDRPLACLKGEPGRLGGNLSKARQPGTE